MPKYLLKRETVEFVESKKGLFRSQPILSFFLFCIGPVWPDLAKFHHFGKILEKFWWFNYYVGKSWTNFDKFDVNGQMLKNKLAIWSHWSTQIYFYVQHFLSCQFGNVSIELAWLVSVWTSLLQSKWVFYVGSGCDCGEWWRRKKKSECLWEQYRQCDQMVIYFFCSIFGHLQQIKVAQQQKFGLSMIFLAQMLNKPLRIGSKDYEDLQ